MHLTISRKPFVYFILSLSIIIATDLQGQNAGVMIIKESGNEKQHFVISNGDGITVADSRSMALEDTTYLRLAYKQRYYIDIEKNSEKKNDSVYISVYVNQIPVLLIHSDIAPGDHRYSFFTGIDAPELRIVGGTAASVKNYPWQVYIRSGDYSCGGTIIADKWILTAAHCLFDEDGDEIPASQVDFTIGSDRPFLGLDGTRYPVEYTVIHEDYESLGNENDLALLRTVDEIRDENAAPINLITQEEVDQGFTDPGVIGTITGWGLTSVEPDVLATRLQKLDIPIVSKSIAELIWGPLPETMIMAGYIDDRGDACSGDSGGPLVVNVNGEYKIAGIVSWGSGGCNTVGGYTRISSFFDWLEDNTGIAQNEYRTVRAMGSDFRCRENSSAGQRNVYTSDTLSDALGYEWKIEPEIAGQVLAEETQAEVVWNKGFSGEARVSVRALLEEGPTNYAGQRVVIGETTLLTETPGDTTLCELLPYTLSASAVGENLLYEWYKNDVLIKRSTEPTYRYSELSPKDSGQYRVKVSGSCGSDSSLNSELTVLAETKILNIPGSLSVPAGDELFIQAEVKGDKLDFIWTKDDMVYESGSPELSVESANAGNTGLYRLMAEGSCGKDSSFPIYVYVEASSDKFPEGVNIWPTLTSSEINIAVDNDALFDVYVYSANGKYLGRKENCRYTTRMNVSAISSGRYYLKFRIGNVWKSYSFIKLDN